PHYAITPLLHSFPTRRSSDLRSLLAKILSSADTSFGPFTARIPASANRWSSASASAPIRLQNSGQWRSLWIMFSARNRSLAVRRSEEHTSELQSRGHLVCRLL